MGARGDGGDARRAIVGGPETVRRGVEAFVERTGADELMVVGPIYDHARRVHSFELLIAGARAGAV